MKPSKTNEYWAASGSRDIADEILDKVDKYYMYISTSGRASLWKRSYQYYYRPRQTGGRLSPTGEQGELTALSVNHYRNLLLHLESIITQQKIHYQPKSINTDVESQAQCDLASSLLSYYLTEKRLERNIVQAVSEALMFSEAFIKVEWDATAGDIYGKTETGATIYEGDLKYTNYNPFDCVRDFTKTSPGQLNWAIVRDFENKYDLAAKFPDLSDKIVDSSIDTLRVATTTTINILALQESDNICVYTLLHSPSPALPNGRYTRCLENGTVLQDGPLPYNKLNLFRIAPDEERGTIFGFTVGFDLLPIQESLDILYSTVISNQSAFGVQNLMAPKGHDLSVSQLAGGMNLLEMDYKLGEVKALQLCATPSEVFGFMQSLERLAETISGIDSLTRGNADQAMKAGMSGSALALIQSMAIQFSAGLQRSFVKLAEDVGTASIDILKVFAAVPRVAEIVGKSKRPLMKEFTGKDLSSVNRVQIDLGNPVLATVAGKANLADILLEKGMIENPDQYIQVLSTGRLEPVIEGKQAQLLLIKAENEQLSQGVQQRVLATDNHQKHILEHTCILSNPDIRKRPDDPVVLVTLEHIMEHMAMADNPNVQRLMQVLHQEQIPPVPQTNLSMPTGEMQEPNLPSMPRPPLGTDQVSTDAIMTQQREF